MKFINLFIPYRYELLQNRFYHTTFIFKNNASFGIKNNTGQFSRDEISGFCDYSQKTTVMQYCGCWHEMINPKDNQVRMNCVILLVEI